MAVSNVVGNDKLGSGAQRQTPLLFAVAPPLLLAAATPSF
jgi:hypothetical protein